MGTIIAISSLLLILGVGFLWIYNLGEKVQTTKTLKQVSEIKNEQAKIDAKPSGPDVTLGRLSDGSF